MFGRRLVLFEDYEFENTEKNRNLLETKQCRKQTTKIRAINPTAIIPKTKAMLSVEDGD
jgi:hypothetical protein